jgi:methyl-accepting chemotaxis protein
MTGVMRKLAAGDNSIEVPARDNKTNSATWRERVQGFKEHPIEAERLAAEQQTARAGKERRQAAMEQHTQDFGKSISGVMASLASSADGMRRAAEATAEAAGEVKALAAQTAKATGEASSQIETVRGATGDAVIAMEDISKIIVQINEVAAAISAAVEQQNATTREIAASVQAVSGATADTANAMSHVVMVADQAGSTSKDVLAGAAEMDREAETLRVEVDQFLEAVRHDSEEDAALRTY